MTTTPTIPDSELPGKSGTLPDGAILTVLQIKDREDGPWVSYTIAYYQALPRKLIMPLGQFKHQYGGYLLKNT